MIGYLLDPAIQVQNENGVTIPGAHLYIYNHNTSDLAETYKDFEGTRNTNPVITDTLGNCTVIAEDGIAYDVVFKDEQDNLLFSKQNITVTQGGSSSGNVQVAAGYGIEVTPSISAGIQKYEVAIDPTIVETFDSITKYVAGDNIVLNDLPNNEKAINLANEVILYENNYQSKLNTKQNSFTNTSGNKGSIQDAAGFYVSDINQTEFTDIAKNYIQIVGPSTASIGKRLYEQNNLLQIDYTDNGNSTYKTLSATPDDVTIWRHRGSGPAEYSLTGACTSAQSAYASVLSGDLTPYSAGANINITNHVVSGKDWTNTINSATSGKLNTSSFNAYSASHSADDVTPYSAGSNINITNHVISGKNWSNDILAATSGKLDTSSFNTYSGAHSADDITPYSAGANINITNHVVSGKDWTNTISSAPSTYSWDVTPYSAGTDVKISNHIIGIDTNGTAIGDYNFIAGYNTYIRGNYNIVAGYNCSAYFQNQNSNYNAVFGNNNLVQGYETLVAGVGCTAKSTRSTVIGDSNSANGRNIYIFGVNNTMSSNASENSVSVCIGHSNTMNTCSGTFLFGNELSGDNGSYNRIKIGFGKNYLEINADGTFYKVVNGTRTQI